jgi:hypothetical protein
MSYRIVVDEHLISFREAFSPDETVFWHIADQSNNGSMCHPASDAFVAANGRQSTYAEDNQNLKNRRGSIIPVIAAVTLQHILSRRTCLLHGRFLDADRLVTSGDVSIDLIESLDPAPTTTRIASSSKRHFV